MQNSDEDTILKIKLNPDVAITSIDDNFPTINDFESMFNLTDILKILLPLSEASITSVQHAATFLFLCSYFIFMYVQIASSGVSISSETQIVLAPLGLIYLLFFLF